MTLYIQLAILGIIAVTSFTTGWKVNGWRHDAEYAARMEGGRIALERTAEELAKLDIKQVTIKQEVQKHVIEKPVYRDCKHDPDALRLLNDTLEGRGAKSLNKDELSEADRPWYRRFIRGDDTEAGGSQ